MKRYTEDQIAERLLEMREYLQTEYHPDEESQLDMRVMKVDAYLSEITRLLEDALFYKGEAELKYLEHPSTKIKILCHNEYRLVTIIETMEKVLTKAKDTLITQISKWKETHKRN